MFLEYLLSGSRPAPDDKPGFSCEISSIQQKEVSIGSLLEATIRYNSAKLP